MAVQDPTYTVPEDALLIEPGPALSWRAIIAGAVSAAALSFILLAVGTALGLSMISPWDQPADGADAALAFGIGAAIFLVVVHAISSGFGGYIAGRLREKLTNLQHDETVFRDTAHGMLVWALSAVVGAFLVANVSAQIASGTLALGAAGISAAGQTAGGALEAAGPAMAGRTASAGPGSGEMTGYFVDSLFRPATPGAGAATTATGNTQTTTGGTTVAPDATTGGAMTTTPGASTLPAMTAPATAGGDNRGATRGEVGRIFGMSLLDGQITPEDKTYVAQLIAGETGMTQADAEKRVDEVLGKAQAVRNDVETKAKEAADAARKTGRATAIWTAVALLVGAFAASIGAHFGGRARDIVQ